ncbi:substrate-binding domain-containing protein [Streptomyces acidicola]|uniref:substrate-binding domain-containing protein n=1 Tax=Streptomyces acidicola TaxID=2596892 RepID=UPI003433B125
MFETIADFFGGLSNGEMWAGALICAVCAGLVALWMERYQGWRRISWSEVYNGPINKHINNQPPAGMWEIQWQGRRISEGSLVMLDVRNSGVQTLEPEHFVSPLTFTFPGRKVVHFKVRDANEPLVAALRPQVPAPSDTEPADDTGSGVRQATVRTAGQQTDTITLPVFTLNRHESFRLLVLLEDDGAGSLITSGGTLKGGRIKRTVGRARRRWATAIGVMLVASLGLGTGVYANNESLKLDATCSQARRLTVTGSTAFSPLAHQVKEAYEEQCPETDVVLEANGSSEGLKELRSNTATETIAMVDTVAGQEPEKGLDAHNVGVIVFAVVANQSLAQDLGPGQSLWDRGLTQGQLGQIFAGDGFRDEDGRLSESPVAVVRADGSGTRDAFEARVTGEEGTTSAPRCTDGSTGVCSVRSTMELLDYVNRTENAIGYAEADALPFFPNVRTVPINGTPRPRRTSSTATTPSGRPRSSTPARARPA